MPKINYIVAFVIAVSISVISGFYHFKAMSYLTCSIQITAHSSLKKPIFQIFYNRGKGIVESDSRSFILNTNDEPQNFSFTINSNTLYGVRLDVLNGPGEVIIKDMELSSNSQRAFFALNLEDSQQLKQIESVRMKEDGAHIVTAPSANDPYLLFSFQNPIVSPEKKNLISHIIFAAKIFIVLLLGIVLIMKLTSLKEG